MIARIENLLVSNFRSIKGTVSIPFNAPIVLLHGTNGMGKTSVLSALEFALTRQIEHLRRVDSDYRRHLLHHGSDTGSIRLTVAGGYENFNGDVTIDRDGVTNRDDKTLRSAEAKFFSERCYLPQATLGRLLEIYQSSNAEDGASPLTRFVNDLLGLDQLNALVDGLTSAFHVARVRNLVPEFRRAELRGQSVQQEIRNIESREREMQVLISTQRAEIIELIQQWSDPAISEELADAPQELQRKLAQRTDVDRTFVVLSRELQEIQSVQQRWQNLPVTVETQERARAEAQERAARMAMSDWQSTHGRNLGAVRQKVSTIFPDLPAPSSDPVQLRNVLNEYISSELKRCSAVLERSRATNDRVTSLQQTLTQVRARIADIDRELALLSGDVSNFASALAAILPHIHGDNCPVCSRDFAELEKGPLSAEVSGKLANLTQQANKLRSLTAAKQAELSRGTQSEREINELSKGLLNEETTSRLTLRRATLEEAHQSLAFLNEEVVRGANLMRASAVAREAVLQAAQRDDTAASIRIDVQDRVRRHDLGEMDETSTVENGIEALLISISSRLGKARSAQETRTSLMSILVNHVQLLETATALKKRRTDLEVEGNAIDEAIQSVNNVRETAKNISNAARDVRTHIVGSVFNTSLNAVWRDLFVRLAPYEKFVPAFQIPTNSHVDVQAILETVHRDGGYGGAPATMLSAGNLNTAALTLFLSLHLSVENKLPWLVLDDPVQSMDDVHIAQLAPLLRMLAKSEERQIILAVHDRALFEYLSLELSPTFEGDRLITIELSKTITGDSVAIPTVLTYSPDKAIAA
jgi:exonuclease SbcC